MSQDSTPDERLAALAQQIVEGDTRPVVAEPVDTLSPALAAAAPTMGNIKRLNYSHEAMVDLIITRPGISNGQLAAAFGYTPAWVSNVMASDLFQARLAERRKEVIDPVMVATIEERFKGLVLQGLDVLQTKLEQPSVKPEVALRAVELGAKALGIGGNAAPRLVPVDLTALAHRLERLHGNPQHAAIEGESRVVNG